MKRKHVIFTAVILAVLWTGVNAYAYWVDKVEAKVKVSFEVPIAVTIIPAQPLLIEEETALEGEPGQADETGNTGEDTDKAHGEGTDKDDGTETAHGDGNGERNEAEGGE